MEFNGTAVQWNNSCLLAVIIGDDIEHSPPRLCRFKGCARTCAELTIAEDCDMAYRFTTSGEA